jgi:hypothetical protein
MSDTQAEIDAKVAALIGMTRAGQSPRVAELALIEWPEPDGAIYYASSISEDILGASLPVDPIELRLPGRLFLDVTRDSGIADDSVDFDFWDGDDEISRLFSVHGEGERVEIFYYFPDVDLLLSHWWGHLRPPSEADGERFKASAQSGFRSSMLPLPRRAFYTGCQAVYGGLLKTQAEISENDCPYSRHLGDGVPTSETSSDSTWKYHASAPDGWMAPGFDDSGWSTPVEVGAYGVQPWGTKAAFPSGTAAKWIWSSDTRGSYVVAPNTLYFRKEFTATEEQALLVVTADDAFVAFLDGVQILSGSNWQESFTRTLTLEIGQTYCLAIQGINNGFISGVIAEIAHGIAGLGFGLLDPDTGLPILTCPRNNRAECTKRLGDSLSYLAFDTQVESHAVNETKGPNITVTSRGNENNLKRPLRVIAGVRHVADCDLLAFTVEPDTKHPDKGSVRALFAISEGELVAITNCKVNGNTIAPEHLNVRYGSLRQAATAFSATVNNYSGTALFYAVLQGDFTKATADDIKGECDVVGDRVRVYTDENTWQLQQVPDRAWWLLECERNKRWGEGYDVARFFVQDFIDLSAWLAETVASVDTDGVLTTGPRSTFNPELIDRSAQQQITDICLAGRIGLPFNDRGRIRVVPLKKLTEEELAAAPVFTDQGSERNICVDSNKKSMLSRSKQSDTDLPNRIVLTFDDGEHGNAQRPLTFEDVEQQLAAGRAFGDTSRRVVEKQYSAFGVTNVGEAARLGNLLLHLGEFDEGGTENNCRITLTTWYLESLEVKKYSVIRVVSSKLKYCLDRTGVQFEYFRVRSIKRTSDLKVEISAQAYPVPYYEMIEDLETPPPIVPSGIDDNPAGPGGQPPRKIGFDSIDQGDDTIHFQLSVN